MRLSESPKASGESAGKLIDEAIDLIARNGWWSGQSRMVRADPDDPDSFPHCTITAINAASVERLGYIEAVEALVAEIPVDFKLTYGSYETYTWIVMYNDYTNKETVLAWMRRAADRLRREDNGLSTDALVGRSELPQAGTSTDPGDIQPGPNSCGTGTSAQCGCTCP